MVATTLVEGKVRVGYGTQKYDLDPGMRLVYDRENGTADVRVVDTELYTSWKDGYYYFKQESLEKIMDVMARWYDVSVEFQDESIRNLHFTGDIKRHANFSIILKALTSSVNVNYKLNGRELILYMK